MTSADEAAVAAAEQAARAEEAAANDIPMAEVEANTEGTPDTVDKAPEKDSDLKDQEKSMPTEKADMPTGEQSISTESQSQPSGPPAPPTKASSSADQFKMDALLAQNKALTESLEALKRQMAAQTSLPSSDTSAWLEAPKEEPREESKESKHLQTSSPRGQAPKREQETPDPPAPEVQHDLGEVICEEWGDMDPDLRRELATSKKARLGYRSIRTDAQQDKQIIYSLGQKQFIDPKEFQSLPAEEKAAITGKVASSSQPAPTLVLDAQVESTLKSVLETYHNDYATPAYAAVKSLIAEVYSSQNGVASQLFKLSNRHSEQLSNLEGEVSRRTVMLKNLPFTVTMKDINSNLGVMFDRAKIKMDLLQSAQNHWCDEDNGTILFLTMVTEWAAKTLTGWLRRNGFWWHCSHANPKIRFEPYVGMEERILLQPFYASLVALTDGDNAIFQNENLYTDKAKLQIFPPSDHPNQGLLVQVVYTFDKQRLTYVCTIFVRESILSPFMNTFADAFEAKLKYCQSLLNCERMARGLGNTRAQYNWKQGLENTTEATSLFSHGLRILPMDEATAQCLVRDPYLPLRGSLGLTGEVLKQLQYYGVDTARYGSQLMDDFSKDEGKGKNKNKGNTKGKDKSKDKNKGQNKGKRNNSWEYYEQHYKADDFSDLADLGFDDANEFGRRQKEADSWRNYEGTSSYGGDRGGGKGGGGHYEGDSWEDGGDPWSKTRGGYKGGSGGEHGGGGWQRGDAPSKGKGGSQWYGGDKGTNDKWTEDKGGKGGGKGKSNDTSYREAPKKGWRRDDHGDGDGGGSWWGDRGREGSKGKAPGGRGGTPSKASGRGSSGPQKGSRNWWQSGSGTEAAWKLIICTACSYFAGVNRSCHECGEYRSQDATRAAWPTHSFPGAVRPTCVYGNPPCMQSLGVNLHCDLCKSYLQYIHGWADGTVSHTSQALTPLEAAAKLSVAHDLHSYNLFRPQNYMGAHSNFSQDPAVRSKAIAQRIQELVDSGHLYYRTANVLRALFDGSIPKTLNDSLPELQVYDWESRPLKEILNGDAIAYNFGYSMSEPNTNGLFSSLHALENIIVHFLELDYFNEHLVASKQVYTAEEIPSMCHIPLMTVLNVSFHRACLEYLEENQSSPYEGFGTKWDLRTFEHLAQNASVDRYTPIWLGTFSSALWHFLKEDPALLDLIQCNKPHSAANLKPQSNPGSQLLDSAAAQVQLLYEVTDPANRGPVSNGTYVQVYEYLIQHNTGVLSAGSVAYCMHLSANTKGNILETLGWVFFDRDHHFFIWALAYLTFHMDAPRGLWFSRDVTIPQTQWDTPVFDSIR